MNKKILIGVIIFILLAVTVREIVPENPNYNYITITVSTPTQTYAANSTIDFYINASGNTHCFLIYPNATLGQSSGIPMNQCPGFDILYMGNAKPTSQSVSGIENHSSILIPTYHYNFDLTNKTSSLMFTLDTSFMKVKPGYYVFYITPLLSDSKYKNFIYLKYLNQVFMLA